MKLDQKSFDHIIESYGLIHKGDKIICAFSGGKDSAVLLYLLNGLKKEISFELTAVHVNHMIRGKEADRDEKFCRDFCKKLDIPFISQKVNVPEYAQKEKKGLEESARILRYEALRRSASKIKADALAVAHSLSDQAETVLFHEIRGAGLAGISGMKIKNGDLIRPLLPFSTEEIVEFTKEYDIPYIYDSTNSDNDLTRNRIRNVILPEMRKINPKAETSLFRLSENASLAQSFIDSKCEETFGEIKNSLPLGTLTSLLEKEENLILVFNALSIISKNVGTDLEYEKFGKVIRLINNGATDKIIEIAKGFSFRIKKNELVLEKFESDDSIFDEAGILHLGENEISSIGSVLTVGKYFGKYEKNNKKLLKIIYDSYKIKGTLFFRFPTKKDRIRMYSMSKNVYQFFKDSKIPVELRKNIPVVCDEEEIIWVPFFGLCDKVRPTEESDKAYFELKGKNLEIIKKYIR